MIIENNLLNINSFLDSQVDNKIESKKYIQLNNFLLNLPSLSVSIFVLFLKTK